jgi:hypothetical protein
MRTKDLVPLPSANYLTALLYSFTHLVLADLLGRVAADELALQERLLAHVDVAVCV